MTFPLLPNQVHTEHNLLHVFCAVYLGPWASRERVKRGRFNDIRFTWSCVAKKSVMALQKLSVAKAVGLLTPCGSDDDEELSEDEIIGNFVTEGGESIVLSSDMLSRVPAMTVAPLTSLLLGEEDYDVAEEGGDCEEGSAANLIGMIRLGRTTVALLHLCSIGLRYQPTGLNLICQSLGSPMVGTPINLVQRLN